MVRPRRHPAMPPLPPVAGSGRTTLAPDELGRLLEAGFQEARGARRPVAFLMVEPDRLEGVVEPARAALWSELEELLGSLLGGGRAIGGWKGGRLLALLPELERADLETLASALVAAGRELSVDRAGVPGSVSLSLGVAHCRGREEVALQTLQRVAEEGLRVAVSGGGNRWVHTELYALLGRLDGGGEPVRKGADPQEAPVTALRFVTDAEERETPPEAPPRAILPAPPPEDSEMARLRRRLEERGRAMDILERRLDKVCVLLDATEDQLRTALSARDLDPGLASIYREVQGLDAGEPQIVAKKRLMRQVFEQNLVLHRELTQP